jgi:hypothetical protein
MQPGTVSQPSCTTQMMSQSVKNSSEMTNRHHQEEERSLEQQEMKPKKILEAIVKRIEKLPNQTIVTVVVVAEV